MAEYPIIMKQKNDQGQYDTLCPQTLSSQIQGNIPASQIEGNIPSTQISGQFPANQVDGIYTAEQTLTQSIAQLFNLTSGSAVPNDVFNILSKAALLNTTEDGLVLPNGDTITYTSFLGTKEYEVNNVQEISETDWTLLEDTEENYLTLITCVKGKPSLRLAVQAIEKK